MTTATCESNSNDHLIFEEEPLTEVNREYIRNKMTYIDFINKYAGKTFECGIEELKILLQGEVGKVLVYITQGEGFYIKNNGEENKFDVTKKPRDFSFSVKGIDAKGNTKSVKKTFKTLLEEHDFVPMFTKLVFKPDLPVLRGEFNTWEGFRGREVSLESRVARSVIKTFTDYITAIWAKGDESMSKYILSWLVHIVQKPYEKTGVALFLTGAHGAGKNIITRFLAKYVFGDRYCGETAGISRITQKHNNFLRDVIFCVVNELSVIQGEFHRDFDKMKMLITDEKQEMEPKGKEVEKPSTYCNFIMFSNHEMTIRIESGDRRYVCIEMGNQMVDNLPFFEGIVNTLYNQNAGNVIYTFLRGYQGVKLTPIPKTKLHREMEEYSLDNCTRFIEEMKVPIGDEKSGFTRIDKETTRNGVVIYYKAEENIPYPVVYAKYQSWCAENGEVPVTKNKFSRNARNQINRVKIGGNILVKIR